ncbi:MAG: hypothetical protein M0P69_15325 [Bacteroidales bacterium]|jgi:hypothetical protein|nr:hypothetical protein [Bacteroidales bacterium]MDD4182140.1 hypothetical protein [Victivallaceae bacterium]
MEITRNTINRMDMDIVNGIRESFYQASDAIFRLQDNLLAAGDAEKLEKIKRAKQLLMETGFGEMI